MICFVLMKLWVYKKLEAVNNESFLVEPNIRFMKILFGRKECEINNKEITFAFTLFELKLFAI